MARLTKVEKFYIEQNLSQPLEDVVAFVGKSKRDIVTNYYNKLKPVETVEVTEVAENPNVLDLMGRNKKYGVVIMTETASEVGDKKPTTKKTPDYVQKIRPE